MARVGQFAAGVHPPTAPNANPPTLVDVTNAYDYNVRLTAARDAARRGPGGLPTPSASDIAEGLLYQKAIMELVGGPGAMPAWFQAWNNTEFQPLKQRIEALHIELATFRAQFANGLCATGHQAPFQVVVFTSGDNPTEDPHNLPPIENTAEILALNAADTTAYLSGYGLSAQGNPIARARRLARHIGYFGTL
ncbi:hypothetical protein B0H13DRAFT_2305334 [Mycena leptocephala]|nr:hypothetical protein B0H13DRAFT_2305334 [Mycena leptocephala]